MAFRRMGVSHAKAVLFAGFVFLLTFVSSAHAVELFEFALESFEHPQFTAHDLRFSILLEKRGLALSGHIKKIEEVSSKLVAHQVRIKCDSLAWSPTQLKCASALLEFEFPPVGSASIPLSFVYTPSTAQLELKGKASVEKQKLDFDVRLGLKELDYAVALQGRHDVAYVIKLIAHWYPLPRDFEATGALHYDLKMTRLGKTNHLIRGTLALENVEVSEPSGEVGCEKLSVKVAPDIEIEGRELQVSGTASMDKGAVIYAFTEDAAYMLDSQAGEVTLRVDARYHLESKFLDIRQLLARHRSIYGVSLSGRLENLTDLSFDSVANANVELEMFDIHPFLSAYALPGLDLGNWQLSGQLQGNLAHDRRDGTAVALQVRDIDLSEKIFDRLHLQELNGILNWHSHLSGQSSLGWSGLRLNRIQTEATRFRMDTKGTRIDIPKLDLPLEKGALSLHSIRCINCLSDERVVTASAKMSATPLSVFQSMLGIDSVMIPGELSLVMPAVTYQSGRVDLDGQLNVDVFGGQVVVDKLILDDVIGRAPRLNGEITVDRIDLEQLTKSFNIGRITGRINGYIRDMRLVNWTPAAFDANFFSTPDEKTKKRISQKAVDLLTEIGGAGGALAQSYMRFFEEFSYSKLGLSCHLSGDTCLLGGIDQADAADGFYILKGSGLPYLSVMGDRSKTSWSELIAKIKVILSSQSE